MRSLLYFFLLLHVLDCLAGDIRSVPLVHESFKIDGIIDEAGWQQGLIVDLKYETSPGDSTPATVSTKAYLVDNGDALLLAFNACDPKPNDIRAHLRDRDKLSADDRVGIMIDTFNDERRALRFFVNPYGAQQDSIYSYQGGVDQSWDAIWDSAGKIHNEGYAVEMEIPYSELQMPDINGEKTWGIRLYRIYPRDFKYVLTNLPVDRANSYSLSQLDKFSGFQNSKVGRDLEIAPSIATIVSQDRDSGGAFDPPEIQVEPSLDINWGIRPNITLSATLNPDFSQVEVDSAQLNVNNTFSLFLPEKRSFFLENKDYFNTPFNVVHTRNIVAPDYGLRVVGKSEGNAYGAFVANDTFTNVIIPGVFSSSNVAMTDKSTNAVFRYRRDVGNASTVGLIMTDRHTGDYFNRIAGSDIGYQVSQSDKINFQYLHSMTAYPQSVADEKEQTSGTFGGDAYYVNYTHNGTNFNYKVGQTSIGKAFRADMGYVPRVGWRKSGAAIWYDFFGENEDFWDEMRAYYDWDITTDHSGRIIERENEASYQIRGPWQSLLHVGVLQRNRFWNNNYFDEYVYSFKGNAKPWSALALGIKGSTGEVTDLKNDKTSDFMNLKPNINLNLGAHWNIGLSHKYQYLKRDLGTVYTANQSDFRVSYQFDLRHRLRLAIMRTDIERNKELYSSNVTGRKLTLSSQLTYSYKINPRTVFYLGYSDSGLRNDDISNFTVNNRAVFTKFSYAWKQ